MEEALFFGERESVLYLRVTGHITARVCGGLRKRTSERFSAVPPPTGFVVDLSECVYMDSTFIGLLVSMNKNLNRVSGGRMTLLRPGETCIGLLDGLGVSLLFSIRDESGDLPGDLSNVAENEETTPELLLHAHEELMEANPANRAKFAGLQQVLRASAKPVRRP